MTSPDKQPGLTRWRDRRNPINRVHTLLREIADGRVALMTADFETEWTVPTPTESPATEPKQEAA